MFHRLKSEESGHYRMGQVGHKNNASTKSAIRKTSVEPTYILKHDIGLWPVSNRYFNLLTAVLCEEGSRLGYKRGQNSEKLCLIIIAVSVCQVDIRIRLCVDISKGHYSWLVFFYFFHGYNAGTDAIRFCVNHSLVLEAIIERLSHFFVSSSVWNTRNTCKMTIFSHFCRYRESKK